MNNILFITAVILVIAWAVCFLAFSAGYWLNIALGIALATIILLIIRGKEPVMYHNADTGSNAR
jgi:hypothetical protein